MLKRAGQATGRHALRLAHLITIIAVTLACGGVAGAGFLAWRLSRGPVNLDNLAGRFESRVSQQIGFPLHIGHLSLAWRGWRRGADQPLLILLQDVQGPDIHVPEAEIWISLGRLMLGEIRPRLLIAHHVQIGVSRKGDEADSRPGDAKPVPAVLREFGSPAKTDRTANDTAPFYSQLRRVQLDGDVTVRDQQLGAVWKLQDLHVDLTRRRRGGVTGFADATFVLNGAEARLAVEAAVEARSAATRVNAHLMPVNPSVLAGDLPVLAPLRQLNAPVRIDASARLDSGLSLRWLQVQAWLGAGTIQAAGASIPLQRADFLADGTPARFSVRHAAATVTAPGGAPSNFQLSGDVSRENGRINAAGALNFDRMAFADLHAFWPEKLGGNARPWLVENITAGEARAGAFQFRLAGPDLSKIKLVEASGQLQGDDLTVHWLRPVPPLEHGQATLYLRSPDVLEIGVASARQGDLHVHDGAVRITGLSVKDQLMSIEAGVDGQVADVVSLLRQERLKLLSAHPVKLDEPRGVASAKLSIKFPLEKHVTIEQIAILGDAKLSNLHLARIALNRDLDDGAVRLSVDNNGLFLSGTAEYAGIPSDIGVAMDFRDGAPTQIVEHITAAAHASAAQLAAAGFGVGDMLGGNSDVHLDYTNHRNGSATADLRADLTNASLSVEPLGWSKPPGTRAGAHAVVRLTHQRVARLAGLEIEAPDLSLNGQLVIETGKLAALTFDRAEIGGTRAVAEIGLPQSHGDAIRIHVRGPVLDLSERLAHSRNFGRSDSNSGGVPFTVDADFARTQLSEGGQLHQLRLHAEGAGGRLRQAEIDTSVPERLKLRLTPDGATRHLAVSAADAGALFHAFGILPGIHGGQISLNANFDDRQLDPPLAGRAEIDDFRLNAPAIIKLAQVMTVYGMLEAARGPGVHITRLATGFRLSGDVVRLDDVQASNSAIGATAKGWLNFAESDANLTGTIVPAYFFNSLLGRIPLFGRLFSPEAGGGVFAASYSVKGKLSNPEVSVNPLTAFTPGVLRQIFGRSTP